ncbi:lysoplasmalogenase [Streptomyces sp. NBC_00102]|uniref:lysoplasmalogenase n=1 Tax=Streptomyces sp. NBC_00102 TaxID=2975652 RepID=UPI002259A0D3|nr:lysoplasmalogenase [Streptomyces sp. NBC_00102]MCX5396223.1 lysoplasmalogenase [Streptomyces sp. NBC_00102]
MTGRSGTGPGGETRHARAARAAPLLLAAYLVLSAVDLVGLLAGADAAHLLAKPLLMPVLAAYAAVRGAPRWLIAALLFGWGGDVALMADDDTVFLLGMGSFALGHLCYLRLFGRARASRAAGAAYAVVLAAVLVAMWGDLPAGMRLPMTGYSLLLATMAWRSGALGRYAAAGGALFLLSDSMIATGIADWPQPPGHDVLVMLTYLAAQLLLTVGALGGVRGVTAGGAYRGKVETA